MYSFSFLSSVNKVFQCFEVYKKDLDSSNVTILYLYFQNYGNGMA